MSTFDLFLRVFFAIQITLAFLTVSALMFVEAREAYRDWRQDRREREWERELIARKDRQWLEAQELERIAELPLVVPKHELRRDW